MLLWNLQRQPHTSIYKDEIYIVSIWSNRQNRANLYLTLRADAKGM